MASKTETVVSLEDNFTIKLYDQGFIAAHAIADGVLQLRLGFEKWPAEVISARLSEEWKLDAAWVVIENVRWAVRL